ncbi:uncharacterized protein LOC136083072 [Hydra vulgaris]|uniref:Uncharacterized protein LOC136083072 n=1 Tax=Hydra vulgaris TaxID=6087 RepID=A0ABM4CA53_HYDVU
MNRAKKLSGAEFKKKRRDRLEKDICNEVDNDSTAEVAATSLITDLNSYHPLELIKEEIFIGQSQDEFGPNDSEAQEDRNSQLSKPIEMSNSEFPPEILEISATSGENFQHSDPATWPKMTDKTRCFLIQHGPEQERREFFPNKLCDFDNRMRHFSSKWYEKIHPNEISKGFCDWKTLNPRIPEHENSNEHQICYSDWKNLEKNLKEGKTLDSDLQRVINGVMKKWRDILKVIVDAILFCAKNNLALWGSTEVIGEQNSGIFLNLIELISHYYPLLAEHVASVKAKKTTTSYFSPRIQNKLIELLGQKVKNEILSNVREAKYFSVLFDCTPDASHKEQMTQIISSTLRWEKLMKLLTISLKGNSDTRWSAKKEAIIPLHRQIKEVLQVLESIIHTPKTNAVSVCSAKELIIQIDFSFLCLLDFWCQILSLIDRENKLLQSKNISIDIAAKKMKGLKASIQNLRDVGVDNIIKAAAETAIQIGIEGDFPMKRKRKVKQMALYEAEDDFCRLSPETDFGSQCNLVFDSILTQIEWRFEAMSAVSSDFDFLSGHSLSKSSVDELKTKAKNLSKIYKANLDSSDFQSEMASFKYQAAAMMENFEKSSPMDILQLIHKYSLTDAYPNTAIAIRIFLTLPVTVATCERSFSKLKIIKNYLRPTMGQERLSCLTVVSIEHEVANALDFDDVISDFASKKARKVTLN